MRSVFKHPLNILSSFLHFFIYQYLVFSHDVLKYICGNLNNMTKFALLRNEKDDF